MGEFNIKEAVDCWERKKTMDEWEDYDTGADWIAYGFVFAVFILGFSLGMWAGWLI